MPIVATVAGSSLPDLCRSAALGFMAGARDWNKRELAEWLACSYRPLVAGASEQPIRRRTAPYGTAAVTPHVTRIQPRTIEQLLKVAHADVLRELRDLEGRSSLDTGRGFIRSHVVTRCIDDAGVAGWAPVARVRARLFERVMSLFAADFVARPWDYEYDLAICVECGAVSFVDMPCCRARSGERSIIGFKEQMAG
jgi:hypothetical protein